MRSLLLPVCLAAAASPLPDGSHAEDVTFLIDAFEEHAGPLLQRKGVDTGDLRDEFVPAAEELTSDQEYVDLVVRLLARLEDGHARLTDLSVDMEGFGPGPQYACGLELFEHDGDWYVKRATGAAAKAGVEAGWKVERIDGEDANEWMEAAVERLRLRRGFSTERAARFAAGTWGVVGPDGETARFELVSPKRKKRKVNLTWGRRSGGGRLVGPVVFPEGLEMIGREIGWTRLSDEVGYAWVGRVPGELPELIDAVIEGVGEDCETLVLDFRSNMGGGYDRDALLGRFVPEGTSWGGEQSAGPNPFTGQLVVIVDPNTISAAETIVGELKEEGRAYLIGPGGTHGASGSKQVVQVPSERLSVRFVTRSHKQRFNGGEGVEGLGIEPHEIVEYDPKKIAEGIDPCIERALEIAKKGIPRRAVSYRPPR